MDQKSKIRDSLIAVYERLSPLEQALMQLCSITYEPVDAPTLMKCFDHTGLSFPESSVRNIYRTRILSQPPADVQAPEQALPMP